MPNHIPLCGAGDESQGLMHLRQGASILAIFFNAKTFLVLGHKAACFAPAQKWLSTPMCT